MGYLICYISGTEVRRKLKFDKLNLQICENFLRGNWAKNFWPEFSFMEFIIKKQEEVTFVFNPHIKRYNFKVKRWLEFNGP